MKVLTLSVIFAALLAAADVSGAWAGKTRVSLSGKVEEDTMFLTLKQSADAVTGTAGPVQNQQSPIRNGKIQGSRVTFDLPVPNGVFHFSVTLDGDRLTGEVVAEAQGQTIKGMLEATRGK